MPRRYLITEADERLRERVRQAAFDLQLSRAAFLRAALEDFLTRHERRVRQKGGEHRSSEVERTSVGTHTR